MKLSARSLIMLGSVGLSLVFASAAFADSPEDVTGNSDQPLTKAPAARKSLPPQAHGLVQLVGEALEDVKLEPKQREEIQKLGKEVEPLQIDVDKAENALLTALADELAKGHIEKKALEPEVDAFAEARVKASPVLHHALDSLHGVLEPKQRAQFVDSLEKRMKQFAEAEDSSARVDEWSKYLGLSAEQKERIRGDIDKLQPELTAEQEKAKQAFEAFRGESFSSEQLMPERDAAARAKARAERVIAITEAIAAVLTPEQRAKAAARLHETAAGQAPTTTKSDEDQPKEEDIGNDAEQIWAARGVRGGFGVSRGFGYRSAAGFGYARGAAFPAARGFGWGW